MNDAQRREYAQSKLKLEVVLDSKGRECIPIGKGHDTLHRGARQSAAKITRTKHTDTKEAKADFEKLALQMTGPASSITKEELAE